MLVGRAVERRLIDQLVAGSRIGNSGVLAVTGEAGVGKTVLLDYARSRLDGFQVLTATGTEPEREIPFAGLLSLLLPVLARLESIPGPQAEALSVALSLRDGEPGDRFAIGAATLSLLTRCAEELPVAVVVDDLQWLDRPSAEAIAFAARRLSADPVALLLAARAGEADDVTAGLPQLSLTGLGIGPAGDLVRSSTAQPVTDDQLARLHELTGGNPLAMLELGSDPEVLAQTGPEVPPAVPAALVASYGWRVRLLDAATRSSLLIAVVANGDLRLASAGCAKLRLDPASLGQAEQAGMISVTSGQIRFRHPLLRAAIYADADEGDRRAAHRAIAEALPDHEVDRRAWHLSEATWAPDAEVASLLAAAAEHAAARTAYSVASTAYERAARLSPEPQDQVGRLTRAAESAWAAGQGERAVALLHELRALPADPRTRTSALQLRAAIAARTGSLAEARDMLEHAAEQESDPDAAIPLLADAVWATFYLADTDSSRRLAEKLAVAVGAASTTQARAVGLVAAGMAKVLTGQGGPEELRSAVHLLSECVELRGDPRRLAWLMLAPLFLRDSETATGELRVVVDEVRNRAGVDVLPNLLFHLARDQATTDSWTRAEANYSEAIRLARETGQSTELAVCLGGLAALESRQGRAAACRSHAAEALPICAERQIHLPEAWIHLALGDLSLALGDAQDAVGHLLRLEGLLDRLGLGDPDLSAGPELADALLRLGRVDEARRVVVDYLASADAKGQPWAAARAQRARGLLAPADLFDEAFREALTLHAETLDIFETARTRLAYGARLRRTGRRLDAREELRPALEVFADLGAGLWAEQAARELDATGEKVPRRDPAGIQSLTPQELQVSLLLAEGRTTRETAAALFLSPKTVEYHLRKVYNKLGIHSRTELADLMPGSDGPVATGASRT